MVVETGDVVVSYLPGARQNKRRPAIVVSAPDYHDEPIKSLSKVALDAKRWMFRATHSPL